MPRLPVAKKLLAATTLALIAALIPSPAQAATTAIGGYPLRPVLSTELVLIIPQVTWAGSTLSVDGPGGDIKWLIHIASYDAVNGQVLPYWLDDITYLVYVERSSAFCLAFCSPVGDWTRIGSPGCYRTVSVKNVPEVWAGDLGYCGKALAVATQFYRITFSFLEKVPAGSPYQQDSGILRSANLLVAA